MKDPHTPAGQIPERPANWVLGGGDVKLTSARSNVAALYENPQELCGVEGNSVDKAWQTTTGLPSTLIAVTDSGIEWCDPALVDKIYLNRQALPPPEDAQGRTKAQLETAGRYFADSDPYDLNGSGIFNVEQYANDPRIAKPYFCAAHHGDGYGYTGISPADLIATFGTPGSRYYAPRTGPAGFTDAIAGWDFVDDDNNPYDAVHYDHGTGTAEDSPEPAGNSRRGGWCLSQLHAASYQGGGLVHHLGECLRRGRAVRRRFRGERHPRGARHLRRDRDRHQAIAYARTTACPSWRAPPTRSPSTTTSPRCSRTRSWSTASHTTAATPAELSVPERLHQLRSEHIGERGERLVLIGGDGEDRRDHRARRIGGGCRSRATM